MMMMPRLSKGFFDDLFDEPFFKTNSTTVMKTDVKEQDGSYMIDIELPGYNKEDIKAHLQDGYLTITASTNKNVDEKDSRGNYIRRERYTGQCSRSFYVGENVRDEDIKAGYKDGVLSLVVPKMDAKQIEEKKYIEIE